ncbi:quinolinate synthetase [candidate division KD3-62 bacterium DG_56]|uniref:Quinolinate synthase n=1 Tax=candidate division KD3-62 bacterium DG_56 TaxID=1704032 RepID=A0A0S7XHF1_9BACT|nr:MAG: quinolinate synthetase [candidate division KD3-62 bacterium DG_56]
MASIVERILALKEERKAVILSHNYQIGEVQDIADFLGDSLELSRRAAATDAETIVFCGVRFMAETAAILSPEKTVLIPDPEAGCPLADMITAEQLRSEKAKRPGVPVVCYVNTSAEVKAESDICCTSANAIEVVNSIEGEEIIFVPDWCLGDWAQKHTDKRLYLWPGYCNTHHHVLAADIESAKREHPAAEVMAHPECTPDVLAMADHVVSTGGMTRVARESGAREFIVGTEIGIIHRLKADNPEKEFYPTSSLLVCPDMKRISLEKVLWALEDMRYRVEVPAEVRDRARAAIERMIDLGR